MSWLEKLKQIVRLKLPENVRKVVGPYDFFEEFGESELKELSKETNRGIGKGHGDFGDVLKRAQQVHSAANDILKGKRSKKSVQKKGEDIPYLLKKFDDLIDEANKWLDHLPKDKQGEEDKIRKAKIEACKRLIKGARKAKEQLIALKMVQAGEWDAEEFKRVARENEAQTLVTLGKSVSPKGGTSEGMLVMQDPDTGKARYAFKPAEGESQQMLAKMGMSAGAGTMREALTSSVCDELALQGFDTGFPKTTLASVDGKTGALVEGLNGKFIDAEAAEAFETPEEELRQEREAIDKISAPELQKCVLTNLAVCQIGDVKYDNMMISEDGSVRPFDAGTAFPPGDYMTKQLRYAQNPLLCDSLVNPPVKKLNGETCTTPKQKMDPDLVDKFLQIDENKLMEAAKKSRDQMANVDGKFSAAKLDDTSIMFSVYSVKAIKKVLTQKKDWTLEEFLTEYWKEFRRTVEGAVWDKIKVELTKAFQGMQQMVQKMKLTTSELGDLKETCELITSRATAVKGGNSSQLKQGLEGAQKSFKGYEKFINQEAPKAVRMADPVFTLEKDLPTRAHAKHLRGLRDYVQTVIGTENTMRSAYTLASLALQKADETLSGKKKTAEDVLKALEPLKVRYWDWPGGSVTDLDTSAQEITERSRTIASQQGKTLNEDQLFKLDTDVNQLNDEILMFDASYVNQVNNLKSIQVLVSDYTVTAESQRTPINTEFRKMTDAFRTLLGHKKEMTVALGQMRTAVASFDE